MVALFVSNQEVAAREALIARGASEWLLFGIYSCISLVFSQSLRDSTDAFSHGASNAQRVRTRANNGNIDGGLVELEAS